MLLTAGIACNPNFFHFPDNSGDRSTSAFDMRALAAAVGCHNHFIPTIAKEPLNKSQ